MSQKQKDIIMFVACAIFIIGAVFMLIATFNPTNSIWFILAIVFYLSAIVLYVLYLVKIKKQKEKTQN